MNKKAQPRTFDPNAAPTLDGIFGLPYTPENSRVVLVPVPWEVTTSYGGGTSRGPSAIREASKQVDLFDPVTGKPYEDGICMLPEDKRIKDLNREARRLALPIIKRGGDISGSRQLALNLHRVNRAGAVLNQWLHRIVKQLIGQNKIVGTVGGDHSSVFGAIRAHAEEYPGMSILHIDAHADLRNHYEGFEWSHASIMRNVMDKIKIDTLVQVGVRDLCEDERLFMRGSNGRVAYYFDEYLFRQSDNGGWSSVCEEIARRLRPPVYISLDVDGLDPSLCPHTGTPVPGGLTWREILMLLRVVSEHHLIVGFDLTEIAPGPKGNEWDANVGARLLYQLIGYTLLSQKDKD